MKKKRSHIKGFIFSVKGLVAIFVLDLIIFLVQIYFQFPFRNILIVSGMQFSIFFLAPLLIRVYVKSIKKKEGEEFFQECNLLYPPVAFIALMLLIIVFIIVF